MKLRNKYLIMVLLDLAIASGVLSITLHLSLILLLNWANLTTTQLVGITAYLIWAVSFLVNIKLGMLNRAVVISVGFVLTTLFIAGTDCIECTVDTFIMAIAIMGSICITAILLQVVVAKLISNDRKREQDNL